MENKDRIQAVKDRVKELEKIKKQRERYIIDMIAAAACAFIAIFAVAMSEAQTLARADEPFATIVLSEGAGGYVVIAIACFALGAAVTYFSMKLRNTQDKRDYKKENSKEA